MRASNQLPQIHHPETLRTLRDHLHFVHSTLLAIVASRTDHPDHRPHHRAGQPFPKLSRQNLLPLLPPDSFAVKRRFITLIRSCAIWPETPSLMCQSDRKLLGFQPIPCNCYRARPIPAVGRLVSGAMAIIGIRSMPMPHPRREESHFGMQSSWQQY